MAILELHLPNDPFPTPPRPPSQVVQTELEVYGVDMKVLRARLYTCMLVSFGGPAKYFQTAEIKPEMAGLVGLLALLTADRKYCKMCDESLMHVRGWGIAWVREVRDVERDKEKDR